MTTLDHAGTAGPDTLAASGYEPHFALTGGAADARRSSRSAIWLKDRARVRSSSKVSVKLPSPDAHRR